MDGCDDKNIYIIMGFFSLIRRSVLHCGLTQNAVKSGVALCSSLGLIDVDANDEHIDRLRPLYDDIVALCALADPVMMIFVCLSKNSRCIKC